MREKNNKWKVLQNGSFTLEAAMIMGVVLFAMMAVLTGTKTVYNKVLVTAKGYEIAITGRMSEIAGLWGNAEAVEVELEELNPVEFLWKSQAVNKEMR